MRWSLAWNILRSSFFYFLWKSIFLLLSIPILLKFRIIFVNDSPAFQTVSMLVSRCFYDVCDVDIFQEDFKRNKNCFLSNTEREIFIQTLNAWSESSALVIRVWRPQVGQFVARSGTDQLRSLTSLVFSDLAQCTTHNWRAWTYFKRGLCHNLKSSGALFKIFKKVKKSSIRDQRSFFTACVPTTDMNIISSAWFDT